MIRAFGAMFGLFCSAIACAGDHSWTQEKVSRAINYKNMNVVTEYLPSTSAVAVPPGSRIMKMQAMRSYSGNARVETHLCWNGTTRCVPMSGGSINTSQFNGLEGNKPIYLVHRAVAEIGGPLPSPVFVKGSVIVWYAP